MAVTELTFSRYEENRVKKYGDTFKNKISPLFDEAGEFNEDNWNGGDPLRDYAEQLYEGLDDKRVVNKAVVSTYVLGDYKSFGKEIKIHTFYFKGNMSLEVFSDDDHFYAVYNNGVESLILKWHDNSGRTESVIIIDNKDIKFNFYDNLINDEYISYSYLSINDYIDMMNDFNLSIDEFE